MENKILFASNGIFRQETLITTRGLILDSPTPVYIRSVLRITTKGRYAVSILTVVFIYSNDEDIKKDFSLWFTFILRNAPCPLAFHPILSDNAVRVRYALLG